MAMTKAHIAVLKTLRDDHQELADSLSSAIFEIEGSGEDEEKAPPASKKKRSSKKTTSKKASMTPQKVVSLAVEFMSDFPEGGKEFIQTLVKEAGVTKLSLIPDEDAQALYDAIQAERATREGDGEEDDDFI